MAANDSAPLVFENAGRVFLPDTCEPLKKAAEQGKVDLWGWSQGNYPGLRLPDGILPGILSLGAWDAHARQGWSLGEHCNEGLEITFLSRGQLSFRCAGTRTMLQPGDVTVTAPWLEHEVGLPQVEPSRLIWVILDVGVRRPNQDWQWPEWVLLSEAERKRVSHVVQNSDRTVWNGQTLARSFEALFDLLVTGDPVTSETDAKIQLNTVLMRLVRALANETESVALRDGVQETIRLFLQRLEEHIDYPWRVDEMARQCGVSRVAFIDHSRKLLNRTPHAHLTHLRLRRARSLLIDEPETNMTQIAMLCGFSSSAHFSSAFRKAFGLSPTDFRDSGRGAGLSTAAE